MHEEIAVIACNAKRRQRLRRLACERCVPISRSVEHGNRREFSDAPPFFPAMKTAEAVRPHEPGKGYAGVGVNNLLQRINRILKVSPVFKVTDHNIWMICDSARAMHTLIIAGVTRGVF